MAEGLIPYVYRTIKRSKSRRRYECITLGKPQSLETNYSRCAELIPTNGNAHLGPPPERMAGVLHVEHPADHRRCRSVEDFSGGLHSPNKEKRPGSSKELVRFRSNSFLSCISGA
ncbi:PREDICTED: uncharacterized protein LOC109115819 [Nelumbo nucifera]|uniref:Uncharacterized protein LOC109115819 n=1 Tax=Nelumbo nucifera TaxID=4432 RepID=A0A1U8QAF3_NELNU|nr:PREDICTED: uncharacterized protein LOC109115819 [Nelumbo nucifera]